MEWIENTFINISENVVNFINDFKYTVIFFFTENKIGVTLLTPILTGMIVLFIWHFVVVNKNIRKKRIYLIAIGYSFAYFIIMRIGSNIFNKLLAEQLITEFTYYIIGFISIIISTLLLIFILCKNGLMDD